MGGVAQASGEVIAFIDDDVLVEAHWTERLGQAYADPAGFEQVTYGDFTGPYFVIDEKNTRAEFVKLWKTQPHRDLPFRFGYPDNAKHNHLMITRPKPSGTK